MAGQGSFAELNDAGGYITSLSLSEASKTQVTNVSDEEFEGSISQEKDRPAMTMVYPKERGSEGSLSSSETLGIRDPEAEMSRQTGDVQIYMYYVKSVGWWASMVFVAAICGFVFCISFPSKCKTSFYYAVSDSRLLTMLCDRRLGAVVGGRQRRGTQLATRVLVKCVCSTRMCSHCVLVRELLVSAHLTCCIYGCMQRNG